MDDTVKVKWDQPLEAVHANGMVVPVELVEGEQNPDADGDYAIYDRLDCGIGYGPAVFHSDGKPWVGDSGEWSRWTIRNTAPKPAQEPVQGQTGREVAPEVVGRLIALCGALAARGEQLFIYAGDIEKINTLAVEARAIQALLEPVNEEEALVRQLREDWVNGKHEGGVNTTIALAVAAGRNLERQAIEKERG